MRRRVENERWLLIVNGQFSKEGKRRTEHGQRKKDNRICGKGNDRLILALNAEYSALMNPWAGLFNPFGRVREDILSILCILTKNKRQD